MTVIVWVVVLAAVILILLVVSADMMNPSGSSFNTCGKILAFPFALILVVIYYTYCTICRIYLHLRS